MLTTELTVDPLPVRALHVAILTCRRAALLLFALATLAPAATWTGGGVTDFWSDADNWGGTAPVAGEALVFAGNIRITPVNDFASGTVFSSITFSAGSGDFVLTGNAVTLSGGATALSSNATTGTMTVELPLTFSTAAPTITSTAGGTLALTRAITNGGLLVNIAAGGPVRITAAITGTGGLTKTGSATLTLSGLSATAASNYTGATIIDGGTVAFTTTNPALTGALFLGLTGTSANVSTLDLADANLTCGAFTVRTNSVSTNQVVIGATRTFTTGSVTVGNAVSASTTLLNVSGNGTWAVNAPGGFFWLGGYNPVVTNNTNQASIDLSGLANFTCNLTTGSMLLGRFGDNATRAGTMTLAATSTISATTLTVGESASGSPLTLRLGSGTNIIRVDNFNIGTGGRDSGMVQFASGTGTLQVRNLAGTGRANLNIQTGTAGTGFSATNTLDLSGHSVDLLINNLIIGGQPRAGVVSNTITFDTGVLDVTTVRIGERSGTAATANAHTSTLNLGGGAVTIGTGGLQLASTSATGATANALNATVNISGGTVTIANNATLGAAVRLANNSAASGGTTANGTLNLTGGTVTVAGNVILGATTRPANATLTLNGGSLAMASFAIGSATNLVTTNLLGGTLSNLAELNGGATVTKSGTGILTLGGSNTYSGATSVAGGSLLVTGSTAAGSAVTVANGATLGGSGTIGGTVTLAAGATLAPGAVGMPVATLTTGAITSDPASIYAVDLDGTTPTADVLSHTGAVALNGVLRVDNVFNGGGGKVYTIVSAGSLSGTFAGVAENAVVLGGGRALRVNYLANSVTLTEVGSVWDGGGTDDNWSTAENWEGDVVPTAGANVVFAGTTRLTPFNDLPAGTAFNSLNFANGAGNFVLGGNAVTLTGGTQALGSGATSGTMTIDLPLTIATAPATITTNAGGTLVISEVLDNGGLELSTVLAGTLRISGALIGAGGLSKGGTGTMILAAANTYGGTTAVNAGALALEHAQGLGSAAAGTVVNSGTGITAGGELRFDHPTTLNVGEPLTIVGEGNGGYLGALRVIRGDHQWSGPIVLGGTAGNRIGVDDADDSGTSSLLLSGGISGGVGNNLTLFAVGVQSGITVSGQPVVMDAAAVLYAHGTGGVTQVAAASHTFAQLHIQQGHTVRLASDDALPSSLDLVLGTTTADAAAASGTLDLAGFDQTIDQLGSGTAAGVVNTLGTRRITNTVAGSTSVLAIGNANGTSTFDGLIADGAGTVSVSKIGTGTLTFSGATAHTALGITTVAAGRLHLNKPAGTTALAGPLTITNGGRLTLGANHQIADTSAVTMSGTTSVFNGTGVNAGQFAATETIASLDITGGCFNAATNSNWTITGALNFTGGGNTIFIGNNGFTMSVGSLMLTNMTATAGATVGTNNSFTVYGSNATVVSTLTVGAGGLMLNGSVLNLRRGAAGQQGSRLVLGGNVTTTGTAASSIREDTNGGTIGVIEVRLSGTAGAVTRSVAPSAGADLTVSIPITDGAATPGSLTKSGAGNLTLSAVNTWTGATTVAQGALLITGSTAAASVVTVDVGGTLGGTGTVNGTVTMNGGTLAPGAGGTAIGTLATGAITWGSTSAYVVDLNGSGPTADLVTNAGLPLVINGSLSVGSFVNGSVGQVFTILSAASISGTFTGIPDGTVIPASGRAVRVNYLADSVTLTVTPPPTVTSITPSSGLMAAQVPVDIGGTLFAPGATVTIGGNSATSVVWVSDTLIRAVTPAGNQGLANVVVTNPDLQSGTLTNGYLYIGPAPTVTGVTPPNGPALTTTPVTISGSGFFPGSSLAVSVGGIPATAVTYVNANTLTATFPAMSTTSTDATPDVVVTNGDGPQVTLANGFTYNLRLIDSASNAIAGLGYRYHRVGGPLLPDFSQLIPSLYGVRANATINGGNPFEGRNDNWSVEFGGYVTVPEDGIYTFYTASDDGSRLYIGTTLVVANNFAQGVTERSGQIALSAGFHRLRVEFAQGNGGYGLFVRWQGPTVGKQDIPASAFTCDPTPVITDITPSSGPQGGGTAVTLSGSNFVAGSLVAIGGTLVLNPVVLDENTITATTPGGAVGASEVLVIGPRSGGDTLAGGFTYLTSAPPTLTAITPDNGPGLGGTTVRLTVTDVAVVPTVTFNGVPATSVVLLDATTVECVTPAMPASDTTATVMLTAGGRSATLTDAFTWTLRAPENPTSTQAGLAYRYYRVGGPLLPDFATQTPFSTGIRATPGFTTNVFEARNDNWSVRYRGYLTVPNNGVYTLYTASDDGSRMYVGDTLVVNNNFSQAVTERSGTIALAAGTHLITIEFAQGGGGFGLYVRWSGPGVAKVDIPASAFTTDPTPVVTALDVINGPQRGGTLVTITGTGFSNGAVVTFGGTTAVGTVVSGGGSTLTCTTPSHAIGLVDVTVSNPTGPNGTLAGAFTYDPSTGPVITAISPTSGPADGGTLVTITGTDLVAPMTVTIGGQPATNVVVDTSGTSLTAVTPSMLSPTLVVDVVVTNGAAQSSTLVGGFTYTLRVPENPSVTQPGLVYHYHRVGGPLLPTFATLTPYSIGVRNTPTIVPGTNPFEARNDNWSVEYRGYITVPDDAVYTFFTESDDGSQLLIGNNAVVQNNFAQGMTERSGSIGLAAGTHRLTIRFAQGGGGYGMNVRWRSATITKAVIPDGAFSTDGAPTFLAITPTVGTINGGTAVTITGSNFSNGTTVTIGGTAATSVVVAGDGQSLTAVTPAHALGVVPVVVTNAVGLSVTQNNAYTYQGPAPVVSAVSPQVGPLTGGTTILIYGSNFRSGFSVTIGGVPATDLVLSNGVISARTPAGARGPAEVTVTNVDGTSGTRSPGFYYQGPTPTITSISPTRGPMAGGTVVTISGTNFVAGATVTFDGLTQSGVTVVDANTITLTTVAGAQGPANVVVTNTDLTRATSTNGYIFEGPAPTVTGISPTSGALAGTAVTITGTDFVAGAVVTFDGVAASGVTVVDPGTITATTPAGTQGPADVTVTNVDLLAATLSNGYIFLGPPPVVGGVSPTTVPNNYVATPITISGSGFAAGVQVTIGGVVAPITSVSASEIIVTMPPGVPPGPAPIVVTNVDLQSTVFNGSIVQGPTPILLRIDVPHGPVAGGRLMTLTGSAFRPGAIVTMGGVPATVVTLTATTITAMTPPNVEGPVAVIVTNDDLLSSQPLTYTYYTRVNDHTVGNGCGTGGGFAVFLLLAFLTFARGGGRQR